MDRKKQVLEIPRFWGFEHFKLFKRNCQLGFLGLLAFTAQTSTIVYSMFVPNLKTAFRSPHCFEMRICDWLSAIIAAYHIGGDSFDHTLSVWEKIVKFFCHS